MSATPKPVVLRLDPLDEAEQESNLRFLDLQASRVDHTLEILTYRRYVLAGQMTPEVAQRNEAHLRARLQRIEQELLVLSKARGDGKARLPLLDLLEAHELSDTEREIFIFTLAPQLDSDLRKRYARYHDNVLLDFPDIQFLCTLAGDRRVDALRARRLFEEHAPLRANKLVELRVPRDLGGEQFLGWEVRPPARLVDYCLGRTTIERSIERYARLEEPDVSLDQVILAEGVADEICGIIDRLPDFQARLLARSDGGDLGGAIVLQFSGTPGTGKTLFTRALATRMGRPLLRVNCGRLSVDDTTVASILETLFFEARMHDAVLCLEAAEPLVGSKSGRLPLIYEQFERHTGLVILHTGDPKEIDGSLERWVVYQHTFNLPEATEREAIWNLHLPDDIPRADDVHVDVLANQFDVTGFQIRNAVIVATNRALAASPDKPVLTGALLDRAAHAQLRASMEEYTVASKISLTLDDLVLPDKELVLIREILNAARVRPFVMNRWGFGRRLVTGKGIVAMFAGEPGTGKTLCAEILANELGLNLYQVSIPKVMSKYIGETEKNIEKIFATARANNSMLLFDEADALFTSRVKVEKSVDRFSNMEVNMLLQEIERFEGIVLLTTNLDKNLDKAFQRRINFRVNFPFPEAEYRALIWEKLVPSECPLADEIDFEVLGEYFELSGGYIKNAVIRAAYRAYGEERAISYEDLLFAAEQECKSAGRIFRRPEDFD